MRQTRRSGLWIVAVTGLLLMGAAPPQHKIDPPADARLHAMSDFLAKQNAFAVKTDSKTDVIENGRTTAAQRNSELRVQRPNKLRADAKGENINASIAYDGKQLTVLGRDANVYASRPAPPTLDAALEDAEARLGLYPPGADFLFSNPYEALTSDVVSGRDLGPATVDGKPTHHLAFQGNTVDYQLWIQDGPQPLPLRLRVISKHLPNSPVHTVELHDWKLNQKFAANDFTLQIPKDAERVEFLAPPQTQGQQRQSRRPEGGR